MRSVLETGAVYVNINYSYGNASGNAMAKGGYGEKKMEKQGFR